MFRRVVGHIRRQPVAFVALFCALGGGAMAASTVIRMGARRLSAGLGAAMAVGLLAGLVPAVSAQAAGGHAAVNCADGAACAEVATPPPGYFPRPSHPVTVAPKAESSHAASKLISSATGGTLSVTGADGTKYALQMPAGALSSDLRITMTPVSSVARSPLGRLIAGVEITPHGLQLTKAAKLTIVPPSPVTLRGQAGFDAAAGGQDFSLYPINPGSGIVMLLNHFSTFGVAQATNAQVRTALSDMPVRTQAQYQELTANLLRDAKESGKPVDVDALAGLAAAYYRDIVTPLTDKALTDDTYAASAATELIAWVRLVALLDLEKNSRIQGSYDGWIDVLTKIIRNAIRQSYQRCVQTDDLSEVVRLMWAERTVQLLGLDVGSASDLAQKCAHFELDVHTVSEHFQNTGDDELTGDITVEYSIPIAMNVAMEGTGEHAPEYTNWQMKAKYCGCVQATGTTVKSTSRVQGLGLDYNVVETKQPDGKIVRQVPPPELSLQFDPGQTTENYAVSGDPTTLNDTIWDATWLNGHHAERVGSKSLFDLTGWKTNPPGSGQLIATKSYPTRTYCGGTYYPGCTPSSDTITETTTLKLYHRPQ